MRPAVSVSSSATTIEGDILLHFSVLREHGRRSVPEGAMIECVPVRLERGLQAKRVMSIDLSSALPQQPRSSMPSADRADRKALADAAGEFEPVEVKWFNRVRGYGFVNRGRSDGRGRLRPHGDGAPVAAWRSPAGTAAGGANRVERQGPDRGRAPAPEH